MAIINSKIENVYPLTPMQEGMLFHSLLDTDSFEYILQDIFNMRMNPNTEFVKDALKLLSKRHEVLRTMFVHEKLKKPRQVVMTEREIECNFIDLSMEIWYTLQYLVYQKIIVKGENYVNKQC